MNSRATVKSSEPPTCSGRIREAYAAEPVLPRTP
jgi:hypothetical protein